MKKLLLVIATLTTTIVKAQTSVYHAFPDSSAVWNFHTGAVICTFGGSIDSYYSITISGDTVISGQSYHKLSIPYVQSIVTGSCAPYEYSGYKGAIREDIAFKKVFYIPPSDSAEQLLYDFNMQVGDTVQGYLTAITSPPDTVQFIDSVLAGSDYRKRWFINDCYDIYLIEGIGSTFGLIEPSPACITDYPGYWLTCFSQNGMTIYPDTNTNCAIITDVENIYPENYLTTVSPNPFSDKLKLAISNQELSEIIIYDIASRKIMQQKFTNSVSLNTEELAKGLYLYEVRSKNGLCKKGKIVKN